MSFEQQESWRESRACQEVAEVRVAAPSTAEKLLLGDAVRLLRLKPLSKLARLLVVRTVNVG